MLYLNEEHIKEIGIDWDEIIDVVDQSVRCLYREDYSQPIKPYLRYRDLKNRIIAMPAFVGGEINMSGIKWIASFPDNIKSGIPRAHSVIIMNNPDTGQPVGIINTALLSVIRTACVTGLIIKNYYKTRKMENIKVGITGFGPIGQYHLKMLQSLLGDKISEVLIYDIHQIDESKIMQEIRSKVKILDNWQDTYVNADLFITCTVSSGSYINLKPKKGSLHLNVSLRDYTTDTFEWFKDSIIVDDWEEVCRQTTDIEVMHLEKGLKKEHTKSIIDVVVNNCLQQYTDQQEVMFNPMGMAVFDIAIAKHYMTKALSNKIGAILD